MDIPLWSPDYVSICAWRQRQVERVKRNPDLVNDLNEYYSTRPIEFINHWCNTVNPRNAGTDKISFMPFCLFPRQEEFIIFIMELLEKQKCGLVEKSRDMGATWVCCALSVWLWIFKSNASMGWGSAKSTDVDQIGNPSSIFQKMRIIISTLPYFFIPAGFNRDMHICQMKIINPSNGATIIGEGGKNIGRGGRTLIYFKDEAAHYERAEEIEASLGDNTNVQLDISSVHGVGNVFHRRRVAGELWQKKGDVSEERTSIFIMDWRDHPLKDQAWYDQRKSKAEAEGMMAQFAQEVDRDYCSSIAGVIIPPAWVSSAIDAHKKLNFEAEGLKFSALDVADEEGADKNAQSVRHGVVLIHAEQWAGIDTTKTARNAINICEEWGVNKFYYDCIGVGAGVRGETNHIQEKRKGKLSLKIHPWNAASSGKGLPNANRRVIKSDRDSPLVKDFYASLKSMAWWEMRQRFEKTHRAVTRGEKYDPDQLISISSKIDNLHLIKDQLSQATWKKSDSTGKIIVNKQPNGSTSPNIADSIVMVYRPPSVKTEFKIV